MAVEQTIIDGVPDPRVKQIDKVTGTLGEDWVEEGELPGLGDEMKLGDHPLTVVKITETEREGRVVYTITWSL